MKKLLCLFALFFLCPTLLHAQAPPEPTKAAIQDSIRRDTNVKVKTDVIPPDTNSKKILVKDTSAHLYNMYLGLLNDDPIYNKEVPIWQPLAMTAVQNILLNLTDHYILKYNWAVVGVYSWNRTVIHSGFPWGPGWQWNNDRFGNSLFLHPYTGSNYFTYARASGYDFWESSLVTLFGSYTWKIFGENGYPDYKPEREAVINTTLGGMVGGEIMYRLSSNIIDERKTGPERVGREILAFIVSPSRAVTRLLNGKMFAHNTEEVYEKEPLDVILSGGGIEQKPLQDTRQPLYGASFNANFDYGDPFEQRVRKPFDYFEFLGDLNFGIGRKIVDNVMAYGLITGTTSHNGNFHMLSGIFQHFDYWDNLTYELATEGIGYGMITKTTVAPQTNLYTTLNLAAVPFGSNSTEAGPSDTATGKNYYLVGGGEAKLDMSLNFRGLVSLNMLGYYYWLYTYVGRPGVNSITILKPRIEFHLFDKFGIGFEHRIYFDDRFLRDEPASHTVNTEEKLFLIVYLADFLHNS